MNPELALLKSGVTAYEKRTQASGSLRVEESVELFAQLVEQYPLTVIVIDTQNEYNSTK